MHFYILACDGWLQRCWRGYTICCLQICQLLSLLSWGLTNEPTDIEAETLPQWLEVNPQLPSQNPHSFNLMMTIWVLERSRKIKTIQKNGQDIISPFWCFFFRSDCLDYIKKKHWNTLVGLWVVNLSNNHHLFLKTDISFTCTEPQMFFVTEGQ